MLADKFWLNPDSKMIWVSDNHIKTIIENPILFEYDGKEQLDKILEYFLHVNGSCAMKYSSVDNFYEKANNSLEAKKLAIFEHSVYNKGYVWGEYDDKNKILSLRSSTMEDLKEGLDDMRDYLDSFREVHLYTVYHNGNVLKHVLSTKKEIEFFLEEMILPRKPKLENSKQKNNSVEIKNKTQAKPKIKFVQKIKNIINKLYA